MLPHTEAKSGKKFLCRSASSGAVTKIEKIRHAGRRNKTVATDGNTIANPERTERKSENLKGVVVQMSTSCTFLCMTIFIFNHLACFERSYIPQRNS